MRFKALLIAIVCLNTYQLSGQTEEEIRRSLKMEMDTIIRKEHYQLELHKVVRNPYQRHYSEAGKGYIKYGGYRLAQLLKTVARAGDMRLEIKGMPQNPSVALDINWQTGELSDHLPAILNDLSAYFEFDITKTSAQVRTTELFVVDESLLKKHIGKPLKPGYKNSSSKRKGKTLLKSYTLEDLVKWVETKDSNKILLAENGVNELRFNFSFGDTSPSSIYKNLEENYGIGHRETMIDIQVLEVSK